MRVKLSLAFSFSFNTLTGTHLPALLILSFEKKYDPYPVHHFMRNHPMIPIVAVILYGVFIILGKQYFYNRPAWNWRSAMALWNLSLSVFSWVGMARTLPQLVHNLTHLSVRDNLCEDPRITYGSGSSGLWVQLFILSKFPYVYVPGCLWFAPSHYCKYTHTDDCLLLLFCKHCWTGDSLIR